ncbi:MAG: N-6 DNA methylase [Muribaculaceae bacterium]|nr:N-6 DNA methylase [Muribaculaceae bacterium]
MSWSILGFIWYRFASPDRILRVEGEQDAEAAKRAAAEQAAAEAIRQMLEQTGVDASHLIPREMPSRNGTFYMRGKRDGNGRVFTMPENLPPRVRQRLIEGRRSGGIIPGNARLGSMQDVAGGGLAGSLPAEGVMGRFTPGEEPVEPETALSHIPYRDGEPDFTAVDAETGWEGLVEAMEGESNAREIAEQMAKDTAKDLEALENKRPKPVKPRLAGKKSPMAMREEQKRAEQANREAQERYDAELEEVRRKAAAWGAILRVPQQREAELRKAEEEREAREAAEAAERKALARINKEYGEVYDEVKGCEAAVERLHSTEPEDIREAASVVLSSHKILWGDEGTRRGMKSETGYGEGERRKMFGMFASRENGGVSLRRLAEDPMKEVCGAHGIAYDSREAMDALLDVLQAAGVPSDIRKYIERRRMAQALELKRQEDAYLREQYEEWCREMYHMSADEYEAYEEYMSEALKNLDENFDEKEYFDNIADEISNIEKNGYREIQKDASEREGRGNGGSGEVLSAERPVQGGRDATDAGQSGLSERDGIQGDGAERPVLEGTSGRSGVRPGFDGGAAAAEGAGTEPTEAQKEAGNYKMDHRRVDGYDISIENVKGSVRRGTGADGKPWETTMRNDYGYIRGTEGVDGDHIDVFLSDTPEEGDVFVVDQVREDGSFDEHKVMYGFPDEKAAREAYLSNYEPGWSGLGAITHVSKDEFKKWIRSSKRKTKPFAQYKSVKAIEGNGMIGRSLAEQEATELIARMEATAEVAPSIELTPENWIARFGEDGTVETPIGVVKMGANQLLKLYSTKRTGYFGMIHPTLSTPDVIIEKNAPAEGAERDSKYLFVKTFIKPDGSRLVHFESVTVQRDGMEVSISSHEAEGKAIKKEMQNGKILHLSESLSPGSERYLTEAPSESEGPDLVPTSDNNIVENEREDGQSLILPSEESEETGALSGPTLDSPVDRKVNALAGDMQADGGKSGPEVPDKPSGSGGAPVLERDDFKPAGKRRSGGKKPQGAVNRVDLEGLMGELSGTGEASFADHSEPVVAEDKPKGGFRVTEEMRAQEEELRKLLGIGDDEGDRGERFRDPDGMTPAEKRMVFRLGVDYAFNFLDNGITGFEDFAKAVTGRLGSKVKPFIKSWYEGAKRVPGYGGESYTPTEEVDRFDIENFDKPGSDVFREAEMRAAEYKAKKAAEQAEREMIEEKRKRIEEDERRAGGIFGEAERVAREAQEKRKKAVQEAAGRITGGKGMKNGEKDVTLKPETAVGDLFAGLYDEGPKEDKRDEGRGSRPGESVAGGERTHSVGADAPGADGGLPAGGTEPSDGGRESAEGSGDVERGAGDAAHGPDAERGVRPPVGNRGRDEGGTDSGSADAAVERGGTSGRGSEPERGADGGAEGVSEGEPAAVAGGGGRPSAVRKPKKPAARYTGNFRYDESGNEADSYTPSQRLEANVKAVETLADVLFGGKPATEEQKLIMSRFRGWGQVDLGKYYDVDHILRNTYADTPIHRLGEVIKRLDPDGEKKLFEAIKRASLSSYYTPTPVARAMNTFVALSGYRGGSLLDPSMGNGMFEGTLPKSIQERTAITGVELDWLSGQLSRALYPDANVTIGSFENSGIAPGSFDVVTSNVPFGDIAVYDPTWKNDASPLKRSAQNRIHNYYAVKMLEATRPGGLVAMMTTSAVMDTPSNQNIRAHIADQGEILGAIRLPDNTFQGTGAVTDIIFVRKWRDEQDRERTRGDESYMKTERAFLSQEEATAPNKLDGSPQKVKYNGYYKLNRRNLIGEIRAGNQYGKKDAFGLTSNLDVDEIGAEVEKAVKRIVGTRRGSLFNPTRTVREVQQAVREAYKGDGDWVSNGNLVVQDGKVGTLTTKKNEYGEETRTFEGTLKHDKMLPRIKSMIGLRTAMKKLVAAQIEGERDETLSALRSELQKAYDDFTGKYGSLQDKGNAFILDDIDGYTLQALEVWKNGKFEGLSDIFTKNSIKPSIKLDGEKTPQEAVALSLAEYGYLRPDYLAKALGEDWAEQCGDTVFLKPGSEDDYVTRDEYLSGDVVTKLAEARAAAEKDKSFERNVKALEDVQPARIPFDDIAIHLGARWIPEEVLNDFVNELLGIQARYSSRNSVWDPERRMYVNKQKSGVRYLPETDSFIINLDKKELGGAASDWETPKKSAKDILQAALEDKTLVITYKDKEGNVHVDEEQTELANQKIEDLRERFETWLPSDPARVDLLEQAYNDRFNRTVIRHFDGSHLVVPGLMGKELRPHQKDAVWMLVNNRGGIVDHIVGAGKTLVMQSAIMEMRRMGIAKKPMIVALKSTVSQIAREFKEAFPSARVLAPDDNDFKKKNRKKFIANISLNDYDCVILSHEQYCMLPHTEEAERVVVAEQLQQLDNIIEYLYGTEDQSQLTKKQIKALEKRRENLKARLEKRLDRAVDREFCFENLGVDYLFVDESHQFKALPYVTSYQRVAGLGSPEGSNRAVALLTGIRYLQRLHQGDKGTVFLSGTTITNSLVEVYNLLNYLRPRKLEELGMSTFDAWASTFAVHSSELEATVTGGFALKDRFRQFDNVAELSQLYAEIADVRNDQNLKLPKPGVDSRTVIVPAGDAMSEINAEIVNMIESKNGSYFGIYPQDPNREPWGLHASTLSAKAAVSPKLIFPDADDGGGKVHAVCENVKKYYDEMSEQRGVQLIFCEMGVPGKGKEYDAYTDMVNRFVNDYGIPRSEIAYIQEANTEEKRKKLFQRVRDGKVRILIGGTKNMGTGVNVQDRITDAHMLTVPWTPSALEQCIGRAARQGNVVARDFMGNKVRVHYYATEGSLDLYKYQLLDAKGKMISQFKTGTTGGTRSFDEGSADEDGNMDPAEMVAILSGNPVIFEKAKQEKLVKKLRALRNGFERDYQRKKAKYEELRMRKGNLERLIRMNGRDREDLERNGFKPDDKGIYPATVTINDTGSYYGGRKFDKPKEAGEYLLSALDKGKDVTLSGFGQRAKVATVNEDKGNSLFSYRELRIGEGDERSIRYSVRLSDDATAAGTAFRNLLKRIVDNGEVYRRRLEEIESQLSGMNIGDGVFPKQGEYDAAVAKLKELTAEYNKLGKKSGSGDGNDGSKTRYRLVEDGEALRELDGGPLKKGYRYVQWAEGGIRPPMTGKVDGKWRAPMLLNRWEQSEEGMQGAGGKVNLVQGNGRTTGGVAYNPYFHIRTNPLNDQFTAAFDRPELMVVEGYYPESEEQSGYRAEGAKDSVGLMDWHSGSVNGQLSGETKVKTMLSRYFKPTRIVPWSEVADMIAERIAGQDITFPLNVVPPMLRAELARRGVKFEGISGSVSAEDRLKLEAIGEDIERGNYDAGLERAKEYQAAYETSEDGMRMRAEELSERLNTPIRLVGSREDADKLPTRRKRRAKGYYEPGKGIVVVLPNHANVADVENTVLHEVVGHDGMRVLFPTEEKLNNALDELYGASEDRIREDIDARTQRMVDAEAERLFREKQAEHETVEDANENFYGDKAEAYTEANAKRESYRREATEEYGADLAGKIGEEGFEKMSREELTFWGKLKAKLQRALENLLRGLKIPKMRKWRDREWAYVLHKAYKAKKNGGRPDVFEAAEDAAMRARAGVDEPMERQVPGKRARIEKLRRSEPVVVDDKLIPENVDLNNRKDVQNYLKANVRGDYTNESDGTKIALTWRGLNEVTHHGMTEPAHVKSLFAIPRMLKKSIYIDSRRNLKGHNGFEEYKYYVCGLVIDGEDYTAKIVIGVKNGQSYYDHRLSKIEKGKLINSLNNFSNEVAENKLPETGYKGTTLESLLQISEEENEKTTRFRDGDMGLDEYVTKIKVEAAKASGDNLAARHDAMKAIGGNLNKLRQAMARQREYDANTVRSVTDLARVFMDEGLLDDLSKMEMKRILGSVNRVVGRQDTAKEVQKVLDIMVDNQLRLSAKAFGSLLKVKGSKVNAAGVEVQGELDARGQQIVQVLKKGIKIQLPEIEAQIDDALDRMGSDDAAVADAAGIELDGLLTAKWYVQEIKGSKTEEQALRDSIKEAEEEKDKGNMTEAAYRQYVAATEDAIRQNKIERAEQYAEIVERLGMKLGDSTERAKAWRAAEKARVDEIHHNANSDMEGRVTDEHHKPTRTQKALNSDAARFLLAPLATFDQMLRMLGRKNVRGEGYLWNRFMPAWRVTQRFSNDGRFSMHHCQEARGVAVEWMAFQRFVSLPKAGSDVNCLSAVKTRYVMREAVPSLQRLTTALSTSPTIPDLIPWSAPPVSCATSENRFQSFSPAP